MLAVVLVEPILAVASHDHVDVVVAVHITHCKVSRVPASRGRQVKCIVKRAGSVIEIDQVVRGAVLSYDYIHVPVTVHVCNAESADSAGGRPDGLARTESARTIVQEYVSLLPAASLVAMAMS